MPSGYRRGSGGFLRCGAGQKSDFFAVRVGGCEEMATVETAAEMDDGLGDTLLDMLVSGANEVQHANPASLGRWNHSTAPS